MGLRPGLGYAIGQARSELDGASVPRERIPNKLGARGKPDDRFPQGPAHSRVYEKNMISLNHATAGRRKRQPGTQQ